MIDAHVLQGLKPAAMRALYEFVFLPACYADETRLVAIQQSGWTCTDRVKLSHVLRRIFDLGHAQELDLDDVGHRAALLPPSALSNMAWRLGLLLGRQRLRQLIRGVDLSELGNSLNENDWRFVFATDLLPQFETTAEFRESTGDFPAALRRAGWSALEAASAALPREIGARLQLKLPAIGSLAYIEPEQALDALRAIYRDVLDICLPDWESTWLPRSR